MMIQERDRHLLRELSTLRVATREQAKRVAGFHSTTRANARLLKLTRAGLLKRFFLGRDAVGRTALYTLTRRGALLVDVPLRGPKRPAESSLVADFPVEHQLAVNDVYCLLKYGLPVSAPARFISWSAFHNTLSQRCRLIPDGYVELETVDRVAAAFFEIDLGHERAQVWQEKVRNYVEFALSGEFELQFHRPFFRVLVLVATERKLHAIRKAVSAVTDRLFWFATLDAAKESFFAPVWWRATGDRKISLLSEP